MPHESDPESLAREALSCGVCGGKGWFADTDASGERVQVRCQWCYEHRRERALATALLAALEDGRRARALLARADDYIKHQPGCHENSGEGRCRCGANETGDAIAAFLAPPAQTEEGTCAYQQYQRTQAAELAPWVPGFDMTRVSVSDADRDAGSPKAGDMIARNPKNHDDRWLVAADYFAANFAPLLPAAPPPEPRP